MRYVRLIAYFLASSPYQGQKQREREEKIVYKNSNNNNMFHYIVSIFLYGFAAYRMLGDKKE